MPKQGKAIPEGCHSLTPYLVCRDAPKAIEFYKKAFNATEKFRAAGPDGRIMHAHLIIGDSPVYLCEEMLEWGSKSPLAVGGSGSSTWIYTEDADKMYNAAIGAGGKPGQPMTDMFWGDRWGTLTDPFGHVWQIATHQYDLTPEEMKTAQEKAMAEMMAKKPS